MFFSTSASLEPSYVLRALGAEEDMAHSSIRSYVLKLQLSTPSNISFTLFMYLKTSRDPCVRFGIGRFTSEEEVVFSFVMSTYDITKSHPQVKYTIERTVKEVSRLRDMSPLWDMVQVCFFLPCYLLS